MFEGLTSQWISLKKAGDQFSGKVIDAKEVEARFGNKPVGGSRWLITFEMQDGTKKDWNASKTAARVVAECTGTKPGVWVRITRTNKIHPDTNAVIYECERLQEVE